MLQKCSFVCYLFTNNFHYKNRTQLFPVQRFLFGEDARGPTNLIFAGLFQVQWYQCELTQIVMASNRLVLDHKKCYYLFKRLKRSNVCKRIYVQYIYPQSLLLDVHTFMHSALDGSVKQCSHYPVNPYITKTMCILTKKNRQS